MKYKRHRFILTVGLIIGYFILFETSLIGLEREHRFIAQSGYILFVCFVRFLVSYIQNRLAIKRGEEKPYPEMPYF